MATKKWKPRKHQRYWVVNLSSVSGAWCYTWDGDSLDNRFYDIGNCFKTEAEAIKKANIIKPILKQP